jgi:hypothetical protein
VKGGWREEGERVLREVSPQMSLKEADVLEILFVFSVR